MDIRQQDKKDDFRIVQTFKIEATSICSIAVLDRLNCNTGNSTSTHRTQQFFGLDCQHQHAKHCLLRDDHNFRENACFRNERTLTAARTGIATSACAIGAAGACACDVLRPFSIPTVKKRCKGACAPSTRPAVE